MLFSVQTLSLLRMLSHGGMRSAPPIHVCHAWPLIISLCQVYILTYSFGLLNLTCSCVFTATSVDVERIFSRGRLLLSHVRSWLSAQTTQAVLCLGAWSLMGMVKDKDVMKIAVLDDVEGEEEEEFEDGWDSIKA